VAATTLLQWADRDMHDRLGRLHVVCEVGLCQGRLGWGQVAVLK